jgi:hypothetical protein
MKENVVAVMLVLALLGAGDEVRAHHSVPVNYDQSLQITIEGVLTQVVWRNPHARFRMDVTNPDGSKVEWLVEMGAVNTMTRAGFPMERFNVGDHITIIGWPGRRSRTVLLRETILRDGTRLNPEMRASPGTSAN